MKREFCRIERLPAYVFSRLSQLKHEAVLAGREVIDFGMGNPDGAPPEEALEILKKEIDNKEQHGYSLSRGLQVLREAQSSYYKKRFGVELDAQTEIVATIGSKEGITSLALAFGAPDDYIVVNSPSYPIHSWGFIIAGTRVEYLDSKASEFLESFKNFVSKAEKKPLAVIVNYPCNPTSEIVDLDFYEELVSFCTEQGIYIISDLAYAEIYFSDRIPPSILQIPGAKDIAIEFTSLSKSFSMAGWRMGFVAGNREIISAIAKIKSYLDYGTFTPLQIAAAYTIDNADYYLQEIRDRYKERRDVMVKGLHELGWMVPNPEASMFIWTKLPVKYQNLTSLEFSMKLMQETDIVVSPGNSFGDAGEGYVRIALVQDIEKCQKALARLKKFLS